MNTPTPETCTCGEPHISEHVIHCYDGKPCYLKPRVDKMERIRQLEQELSGALSENKTLTQSVDESSLRFQRVCEERDQLRKVVDEYHAEKHYGVVAGCLEKADTLYSQLPHAIEQRKSK